MKSFKGFNKDLKCRDFQYEIGQSYEINEPIECCSNGFHSCENPLDVFNYYPPNNSRYCEVESDGQIDKDGIDSKLASSKISIGAEIGLKGLIEAGVKFIFEKVDWKNKKESNTGAQSAATNTGYKSAASVEGKDSIACGLGIENKAKGALGCWIVLTEWHRDDNYEWHIKSVKSALVDGVKIKADTFYTLKNGRFIKAKE